MKIKKTDQEEFIMLADELLQAAIKVVGNEADRSLHQHIGTLYKQSKEIFWVRNITKALGAIIKTPRAFNPITNNQSIKIGVRFVRYHCRLTRPAWQPVPASCRSITYRERQPRWCHQRWPTVPWTQLP